IRNGHTRQLHLEMATALEECTLEEQRSVARFLQAKGITSTNIQKKIFSAYSENCLSVKRSTVALYRNFGMLLQENVQAY
ncbi:hypothetical protein AVEN_161369-1, partial [Araneus ventricosus]